MVRSPVPSGSVSDLCAALRAFLGETEGPFLGADLRTDLPGAQAGSRRLRAAGVDALTLPSTRRRLASRRTGRIS